VAFALEAIGEKKSNIKPKVLKSLELVGLKSKVREYPENLSGGDLDAAKMEYFMQSLEEDPTGESFVSTMALAAMENDEELKPFEDDFSGNLIHSGFRICFDSRIHTIPSEKYYKEDIRTMTQKLSTQQKLKNFDAKKYVKSLEKVYVNTLKRNLAPIESTKAYIAGLRDFYNNNDALMKADIASALYQNLDQTTKDDIAKIFDLVKEMDSPSFSASISRNEYEESSDKTYSTSRLNYEIHDAIQSSPLIGLNAKTYTPSLRKYNFAHKVNFDGFTGGAKSNKSKKCKKCNKKKKCRLEDSDEEEPVQQGGDKEFDIAALI
jgi:hypothetical protein